MNTINVVATKFVSWFMASLKESVSDSETNLKMIASIGVVGFPLFYFIWTWLFPQESDNPALRLVGFLFCVGFVFHEKWQHLYPRFFLFYWFTGFTFTLSFFFVYHLLANNGNLIWSMSALVGLMLTAVLVSNWLLMVLINVTGAILALGVFWSLSSRSLDIELYLQQIPVFVFALITISVFNHRTAIVREAKQKALANMGASIAHELRTPLLSIETAADTLLGELKSQRDNPLFRERVGEFVERVRDDQKHANTVIEMLLIGLSDVNSGYEQNAQKEFSIGLMMHDVVQRFPFAKEQNRNYLKHWIVRETRVVGSELLIMHVLFNLLKNAFRAIEDQPDGEITVIADLDADSGRPVIRVRDNGCGIAPSVLPRIFDDFFTTSRLGRGSGIGLAFCKRVMKQHGGEIRCESEYGLWTEFTLLFPRAPMEATPSNIDQRAVERSTPAWLSTGQAALIVDDEEINRKRLASMIGGRLRCDFAGSVREARARLRTETYAVIFCDQHMPGGQGADFLAGLNHDPDKSGQAQTRRILVSGDWTLTQQLLPGVDGILLKPLEQAKVDALFGAPEEASAVSERHKPVSEPLLHLAHDLCSPLSALEHLCERMHQLFASLEGLNARLPHEQRLRHEEVSALQSLPQQFERVASLAREKILRLRNEGEAVPPSFPAEMHRLWRNSDMLCRLTLQPTLPRLLSGLEQSEQCVNGQSADRALRDLRSLTSECTELHEHAMSLLDLHRKVGSQEIREVVGAD